MVKAPDVAELVQITEAYEELEKERKGGKRLESKTELLSELSQARIKDIAPLPSVLEKGQFAVTATKKYFPRTALIKDKIENQFPNMKDEPTANYFVEIHDDLLTNTHYKHPEEELQEVNEGLRKIAMQK